MQDMQHGFSFSFSSRFSCINCTPMDWAGWTDFMTMTPSRSQATTGHCSGPSAARPLSFRRGSQAHPFSGSASLKHLRPVWTSMTGT